MKRAQPGVQALWIWPWWWKPMWMQATCVMKRKSSSRNEPRRTRAFRSQSLVSGIASPLGACFSEQIARSEVSVLLVMIQSRLRPKAEKGNRQRSGKGDIEAARIRWRLSCWGDFRRPSKTKHSAKTEMSNWHHMRSVTRTTQMRPWWRRCKRAHDIRAGRRRRETGEQKKGNYIQIIWTRSNAVMDQ